jgi:tetratricopeptide (TPR) repeat protein
MMKILSKPVNIHFKISRFILPLIFISITSAAVFSQDTRLQADPGQLYKKGIDLLERKNFAAARRTFEQYLSMGTTGSLNIEAEYYRAFSGLNLFNDDAEGLMLDFIQKYPGHPRAVDGYFDMGNFFYRNRNYKKSAEYLDPANTFGLSPDRQNEVKFKLAYSRLNLKDTSKALENFIFVSKTENTYRSPSAYYAGYIELHRGRYDSALVFLETAGKDESYRDFVPPLIIQAWHDKGDYDKVIQLGTSYLNGIQNIRDKPNIILMLADAYFAREKYPKANQYFNDFINSEQSKPNTETLLKAGISAYHTGFFIDAAGFLKQAALAPGRTGQLASYYLGKSYISLENKPYALSSFDAARKETDDKSIQEEALFYYGKLSFELGNFSNTVEAYAAYNVSYPGGKHKSEVSELLSEAYLRSENYEQAIVYIESVKGWSDRTREVYQKVTFRKGTQLFNAGMYPEALEFFQKSQKYSLDKETTLWTFFWIGETYSVGNKYEEAIQSYSGVFRNDQGAASEQYLKSLYGIGYAYFNSKAYDKALVHFKAYTERLRRKDKSLFYNDALLRLADCYYAARNYPEAIRFYNEALDEGNPEKDYCYFQLGLNYGIQSDLAQAFKALDMIIEKYPNSVYYDDALFQKAQITFEHGDYEPAITRFSNLVNDQPQSPYIPYALVSRAVAAYNLKIYNTTIDDYKRIIKDFPRHPVANSAILGLQEALTTANRATELKEYLDLYKLANPESKDLTGIEFESAKTMYYNENYPSAIEMLSRYLEQYNQSPFTDEVNYYLGESYYKTGKNKEAIGAFARVLNFQNSKWYNRSVQRLAEVNYRIPNYNEAVKYYRRLLNLAGNKREEYNAWTGLMQSYYGTGKFDSTIYFGDLILQKGSLTASAQIGAHLYLGKAWYSKGNTSEAMDQFLSTVNTAKDENGAEAQYLVATIQREKGNFLQSNETLYNLNENFNLYASWVGKSFLMIADNFISLGEIFQARATLTSIIDKSPVPAIVDEARKKLGIIGEKQKVENDSIK